MKKEKKMSFGLIVGASFITALAFVGLIYYFFLTGNPEN